MRGHNKVRTVEIFWGKMTKNSSNMHENEDLWTPKLHAKYQKKTNEKVCY